MHTVRVDLPGWGRCPLAGTRLVVACDALEGSRKLAWIIVRVARHDLSLSVQEQHVERHPGGGSRWHGCLHDVVLVRRPGQATQVNAAAEGRAADAVEGDGRGLGSRIGGREHDGLADVVRSRHDTHGERFLAVFCMDANRSLSRLDRLERHILSPGVAIVSSRGHIDVGRPNNDCAACAGRTTGAWPASTVDRRRSTRAGATLWGGVAVRARVLADRRRRALGTRDQSQCEEQRGDPVSSVLVALTIDGRGTTAQWTHGALLQRTDSTMAI